MITRMAKSKGRTVLTWLGVIVAIYLVGVGGAELSVHTHSAAGVVVWIVAGFVGLAVLVMVRTRRPPAP